MYGDRSEISFLFRLVPYVGEVSPRQEAAAKTGAPSHTAPEAQEKKERDPCVSSPQLQRRPPENRLGRPPQWKQLYTQPSATCQGGREGKVAEATGLSRALNPKMAPD